MNNYEQATQEVRDAFNALCKGRVKAAVEAEREACAGLCDRFANRMMSAEECAEAIRARGDA